MTDYRTIRVERIGAVLLVTLARQERLNAVSLELAQELVTALHRLDGARAVAITGQGYAFCAGADLLSRSPGAPTGGAGAYERMSNSYNPIFLTIAQCPVPVVCAVNGAAAGFGCSLALAADLTLAAESAYFLQPFVNIGLVPDTGATWMLPRLVGKARAMEMMMLGEKISARKAEDWGLIHRCVPHDSLMPEALALAERLSNGPTVALGLARRAILESMASTLPDALAREAEAQRIAADTQDACEGVRAFGEKRRPEFTGR